jgi:hypothetical protein
MVFTRKQWIIIGSVGGILVVAAIVGISVGVVVGRQQSGQQTIQQRVENILAENPLIDG